MSEHLLTYFKFTVKILVLQSNFNLVYALFAHIHNIFWEKYSSSVLQLLVFS